MIHYALKLNSEYLGLTVFSPDREEVNDYYSYHLSINPYPIWNTSEKNCIAAINAIKKDIKIGLKNGVSHSIPQCWIVPFRKSKGYKQPYLKHIVDHILNTCPDTYKLEIIKLP